MTYFTDSVYEKMMVQKPKYGQEHKPTALKEQKRKKSKIYGEIIIKRTELPVKGNSVK